ncbi:MAG: copper chaperone PCu(A)C [Pseudomonadota bacterium]|nr:copper chaperone PCu(A)C [Pseudomonadota bacterium]
MLVTPLTRVIAVSMITMASLTTSVIACEEHDGDKTVNALKSADNTVMSDTSETADALAVQDAYVRAPIPGNSMTAVYLTLSNYSDSARTLTEVSAPWATKIEIHTHDVVNGVMRMRQVDKLEIPSDDSVQLEPGGLHLMVFGVDASLAESSEAPLTLCFDGGECQAATARVKGLGE